MAKEYTKNTPQRLQMGFPWALRFSRAYEKEKHQVLATQKKKNFSCTLGDENVKTIDRRIGYAHYLGLNHQPNFEVGTRQLRLLFNVVDC